MTISPPSGFNPNSFSPFIGIAIRFGAGAKASALSRSLMLIGNMIGTDITRTVGATNYTTTAGTATVETAYFVASPEDADALFGAGSELANDCRAAFTANRSGSVYAIAVAESAGARATNTLTFAGSPTAAGVIRLIIAGRTLTEVSVAAGDAVATIAAAVANVINQQTNLMVTATQALGVTTITAKQKGPRGNNIALRCEYTSAGGTVQLGAGVAGRLVSGRLAGGTTADNVTNALAAIANGEYFIAASHDDATNINRIRDHVNTYAGIASRKRQQFVVATTAITQAAAITLGQGCNAARGQLCYLRDASPGGVVDPFAVPTGEIAANEAAVRLYGDGNSGGTVRGEVAYPAMNANGAKLAAVKAPELIAARLSGTEIEALLAAGVTPVVASTALPGCCEIVRSVTMLSLDASNNPTDKVKDTSKVTVIDVFAARLESRIANQFPNKNLAPEPEDPSEAPATSDIVFPSHVKSAIISEIRKFASEGNLVNVDTQLADLQLDFASGSEDTLLAEIPVDVIGHFHKFAGTLSQVG